MAQYLIKVLKLTPEGYFLEEYESVTEAAKQNDIQRSAISKSCSGERKLGGGFKWVYGRDLSPDEYNKLITTKEPVNSFEKFVK